MVAIAHAIGVFLADDHVVLREGLKSLLQQEGFNVVGEASDGHTAVRLCAELTPQIAVLDIAMPLLNGIDTAKEIRKASPETKIILLTVYSEECYVLESLRAGVSGYVLKTNASSHLLQAIEAVRKDETYLSPGVSRTVVQALLSNAPASTDPLSGREREVLQLIAEGKNMKEIGGVLGISAKTAESHRARIMQKLNIHDIAGLVRYAIENGLLSIGQRSNL